MKLENLETQGPHIAKYAELDVKMWASWTELDEDGGWIVGDDGFLEHFPLNWCFVPNPVAR